jgi:hypothetical protein
MNDHGLEWMGRRYLVGNPLFLYRVLKQRLGLLHYDDGMG